MCYRGGERRQKLAIIIGLPRKHFAAPRKGAGAISGLEIPMVKDSSKESARHDTQTFEYKTWHGDKRGVLPIRDVRQTMQGDTQIRVHKIGKNSVIGRSCLEPVA